MQNSITELIAAARAKGVVCKEHVSMRQKTSFKIGGKARVVFFPASAEELAFCLRLCHDRGEKPFLLGNGSNLLVKDSGLEQPVIATRQLQTMEAADGTVLCQAGRKLGELCVFAQKQGLAGLEFAYGIPGTVGGAVYMNAGAYGGEMKDVLQFVWYADAEGRTGELPAAELRLGYRHSVFAENGAAIFAARFALQPGDPAEIREKMDEIMRRRQQKQPLEYPSAGSVFKRPPGRFAGALIEQCGLKGRQVGGAQVSEKHAGFIVNRGGATAADVRALIALVQSVVEAETGVFLEPEIQFV